MKQFEIPSYYKSSIISEVKRMRKLNDPRKKDFTPTKLRLGNMTFLIARHFGFCYGVENAIEISYKAIQQNSDKRIFLLSQMIHNPGVNNDLIELGVRFIQDTHGNQLIPWSEIQSNDIVIIPAFGTTLEIEKILQTIGVDTQTYNTTCPFVEKVWNRSEKLGNENHTIIIHGKHDHEETRATFSHSASSTPSLIIKDIKEAAKIVDFIAGRLSEEEFLELFSSRYTPGFSPTKDLQKIGVVNQTTMLASETQEITDLLREAMVERYGEENLKAHIADTRDTLCYATNDNQSATFGLLENEADFALVIGGYNSSNTTHLVELLETKFQTYFIESSNEIRSNSSIQSFDIHQKKLNTYDTFIPNKETLNIIITSGASCPDAVVDDVIRKMVSFQKEPVNIEEAIQQIFS